MAALNNLMARILGGTRKGHQNAKGNQEEKLVIPDGPDLIDPRTLIETVPLEELNRRAEHYFASVTDWDSQLSKPFSLPKEVPELLMRFAQVLQGLRLLPGMSVLDFGSGWCWTSRYLTQLGMEVIALDVSPTALRMGAELYKLQPVFGDQPPPRFLVFDGLHIDLPDTSVERVLCYDALHHVPNPEEVLQEMGRVLQEGGLAGFSEPGPDHSQSPTSQFEMRCFGILENDIDIRAIWRAAQKASFTKIEFATFNSPPFCFSLDEFENFLDGGSSGQRYLEATRTYMRERRFFFLHKGELAPPDSRQQEGLLAELSVALASSRVEESVPVRGHARVTNKSSLTWLPTTARVGAVHLGTHLLDDVGRDVLHDHARNRLTPGEGRRILPGETVEFEIEVPAPPKGRYILEFDLVSERVCWFAQNGSKTVRLNLEVV